MRLDTLLGVFLAVISSVLSAEETFYELLGVEKNADNREIRKAFKKIAMTEHPDKKQDDPQAHDKFVKINRAYEVLKDEELRKKYDQHGEEGLDENFHAKKYQSWNFYRHDFGIYDDDAEIITLSLSDFEQSVENTEDVWFINYYSPNCGHCHELAPTWREVAKELEGVVRIGAVNCEDDWQLCHQQGIRSYPSLLLYPKGEKFQGERTVQGIINRVLQEVTVRQIDLMDSNYEQVLIEHPVTRPWLVSFCSDEGDCLSERACLKLASILDGLVTVARVECSYNLRVCQHFGQYTGAFYYSENTDWSSALGQAGVHLSSLDTKEVSSAILQLLPETALMTQQELEVIRAALQNGKRTVPLLVQFVQGQQDDFELRKLPVLLEPTIEVGKIDCSEYSTACATFSVVKYPTFGVFKTRGGAYEVHHGRATAHDVAAFARDSAETPVEVLGAEDFPDRVVLSSDLWIVDFFAPWCPPCMRLLPEFRKASKMTEIDVKFGTVDCTVHSRLCEENGINSYPTTIFYNQTDPHKFSGEHQAEAILEFISDILSPPVLMLNGDNFHRVVSDKEGEEILVVDYFAPWCGPCMQLAPVWRKIAKIYKHHHNVSVASVDCQANPDLCNGQGVHSYPTIRLYNGVGASTFVDYDSWFRDVSNIRSWIDEYLPSLVKKLNPATFDSVILRSPEPWVIDFFAPWCGPCMNFAPVFGSVAREFEGRVNFGTIDCQRYGQFCSEVYIQAYPTVRFYAGGSHDRLQSSYGEKLEADPQHITRRLNAALPKSLPETSPHAKKTEL